MVEGIIDSSRSGCSFCMMGRSIFGMSRYSQSQDTPGGIHLNNCLKVSRMNTCTIDRCSLTYMYCMSWGRPCKCRIMYSIPLDMKCSSSFDGKSWLKGMSDMLWMCLCK